MVSYDSFIRHHKYKKKRAILYSIEDSEKIEDRTQLFRPFRSRIMASKDGIEKTFSIDDTLKKYGHLDDQELVKITHKENTPWSIVGGFNYFRRPKRIPSEVIFKYHINEGVD